MQACHSGTQDRGFHLCFICLPALPRFHKLVYIKIDFDRHFDYCKRPQKRTMQIDILSLKLNIDHTVDEHKYSLLVKFSLWELFYLPTHYRSGHTERSFKFPSINYSTLFLRTIEAVKTTNIMNSREQEPITWEIRFWNL